MLQKLSSIHNPKNQKNACRALHRLVEHAGVTLPLSIDAVQITIKRLKPLGEFKAWWPFISMKTWASYLLEHYPGMLLAGFSLSNPRWSQTMRKFWKQYQSVDPSHSIYSSDYSWDTLIPYCFHGDEGRGSGKVPFLVMSWQPILSHRGMDECNDSSQPWYLQGCKFFRSIFFPLVLPHVGAKGFLKGSNSTITFLCLSLAWGIRLPQGCCWLVFAASFFMLKKQRMIFSLRLLAKQLNFALMVWRCLSGKS